MRSKARTWPTTCARRKRPAPDEKPPPAARLLVANATIEALGVHYANTAHRLLNLRDEGTGFINGMGRYNGKSDAERGDWCSAWNCDPHSIDRLSRESLRYDDWGISLLMGLTPSQMKEAAEEARQDGLLARMLQCVVRPVTGKERPSNAEALAARTMARWRGPCMGWASSPRRRPRRGRSVRHGAGAVCRSGRRVRRQQQANGRMAAQGGREYAARRAGVRRGDRGPGPDRAGIRRRRCAHR